MITSVKSAFLRTMVMLPLPTYRDRLKNIRTDDEKKRIKRAIAKDLRHIRVERKLRQLDLASELGIKSGEPGISRWENPDSDSIPPSEVQARILQMRRELRFRLPHVPTAPFLDRIARSYYGFDDDIAYEWAVEITDVGCLHPNWSKCHPDVWPRLHLLMGIIQQEKNNHERAREHFEDAEGMMVEMPQLMAAITNSLVFIQYEALLSRISEGGISRELVEETASKLLSNIDGCIKADRNNFGYKANYLRICSKLLNDEHLFERMFTYAIKDRWSRRKMLLRFEFDDDGYFENALNYMCVQNLLKNKSCPRIENRTCATDDMIE